MRHYNDRLIKTGVSKLGKWYIQRKRFTPKYEFDKEVQNLLFNFGGEAVPTVRSLMKKYDWSLSMAIKVVRDCCGVENLLQRSYFV